MAPADRDPSGEKAYIITGPTSGIGRRTALELGRHGTVVLAGRDRSKLDDVQRTIARRGGKAVSVVCDLSDLASVRRAAAQIIELGLPIVGLLNNAGIAQTFPTKNALGWDMTFATNHLGPFELTEALAPHLPDGAHVVFIFSGVEDPERKPAVIAGFRGGRYISAEASARGQWAPGGSKLPGGPWRRRAVSSGDMSRDGETAPAPPGGWLDGDQQRAWLAYIRVQLRLAYEMNSQLLTDSGMSLPDYDVLTALSVAEGGRMPITVLAAQIGWERSRVSHHVRRMSARGLVTCDLSAADRRVTEVTLTARGREAQQEAAPGHVDLVRRLFFGGLPVGLVGPLSEALESVYANIIRQGSLPAPVDWHPAGD